MNVPPVALVDGAADWVGAFVDAFVGAWVAFLVGAVAGVRIAVGWVDGVVEFAADAAGRFGWAVEGVDAIGAVGADENALDAVFGAVVGAAATGGSPAFVGATNGGRAARTGADLKPSKTTMAVMVPIVESATRFMTVARASQFERLAVNATPRDAATSERANRCLGHRRWPAQVNVVLPDVGDGLRQSTG